MNIRISLSTVLVALVFSAIGAGVAVGLMAWEPWDGDEGSVMDNEGTASVLCEDALERRMAFEDALRAPVTESGSQAPLSAYRGRDPGDPFRDEITRLESKLRDIESEIARFC